jgi:3-carboxy-cis,cis-muconate cycloisomerase
MANLFWPGSERRGDQFTEVMFLQSMLAVEAAWLTALTETGIAPEGARHNLLDVVTEDDLVVIATEAEAAGNPVVPLVGLVRERLRGSSPDVATWLHRGLTSQDVVDTAIMLMLRETMYRVRFEARAQVTTLIALADRHRDTPMVARTLTQHAVPLTFGLKAAQWLRGILDVMERSSAGAFQVQIGGAAGTLAAVTELAAGRGAEDPPRVALEAAARAAKLLDLTWVPPWHTSRGAITALGGAAVRCTDAWGRIANDVLVMSRPEVGEVSEGSPGGSSTMPHKRNPVLASLIRRAAVVAPGLGASLHVGSMDSVDERAGGAWQAEWGVLADLERALIVAASQTTQLLAGLQVHEDRLAANLAASLPDILAEQRVMADLVGRPPATDPRAYLGASHLLVDEILDRARAYLTTYGADE